MDIFGDNRETRLVQFQEQPCLFTYMQNSTCSAEGKFSNVEFHEQELSPLLFTTGYIVKIDSNWTHQVRPGYTGLDKKKTSKRGRHKKTKKKKNRKIQGDGMNFNSSIQFSILGTHIREKPEIPDIHSHNATPLPSIIKNGQEVEMEKIIKEYKPKLFRNGVFQVPGVLTEDMSDVEGPLRILEKYLNFIFLADVERESLFSVMRNYKFKLHDGYIDLKLLQDYCARKLVGMLNTNPKDIERFLLRPILEFPQQIHPYDEGWIGMSEMYTSYDVSLMTAKDFIPSTSEMISFLEDSENLKNVYVNPENLTTWIREQNYSDIYLKFIQYIKILHECGVHFSEIVLRSVLKFMMIEPLSIVQKKLLKHPDNDLASIKYDDDKYPGFLIKIKTPLENKPEKRTTIKIFPKGKINIDGANNRQEATFIYWWLNQLFTDNPQFIYDENYIHDETDSEFSESEELPEVDVNAMLEHLF